MGLKAIIKKIPGLQPAVSHTKTAAKEIGSIIHFLQERRIPRGTGPIRVGFLCQYLPVWHKLQPIYAYMRQDARFEPMLICVPSGIKEGVLLDTDSNDTLEYFHAHGWPEAISALQSDGTWLDLRSLNLAYIFYPRPYDSFMPKCYWSSEVSKYSKICLILYGMNTTREIVRITLDREFFRYVFCYFAELPYSREQNIRAGRFRHRLGLQRSVYFGMPGIEALLAAKDQPAPAWDCFGDGLRVLWTPRWTTDLSLGGSNFFTYHNVLLDYAQKNPAVQFLFRPHPLAISHFLQTGEMTQQEADLFIDRCNQLPNVCLDKEKEYAATLWGADVMITDISGLIPEFFVTGKPLIFCASNMILTPEETTAKILSCSYIVNNQQELLHCLNNLQNGVDPLTEKRQAMVQTLYCRELCDPGRRSAEYLAEHYFAKENRL